MRSVPEALQLKLNAGATTLCRCWIMVRNDGATLGFTDHDEDIIIAGTLCHAGTGLAASETTNRFGLAVDNMEVAGALSDDALTERDLAAGLFDGAAVTAYLVDWSEPSLFVKLMTAKLGEVRRESEAFAAELRGLSDQLAQESGRLFSATCTADLGDARCGVSLVGALTATGTVSTLLGVSQFVADGLSGAEDGRFTSGRISWTSGANTGLSMEIKEHRVDGSGQRLTLWQAMPEQIAEGDGFTVSAGCDKNFSTCRDRFANAINFRGFPHIPGNDFVLRAAKAGAPGNDGKSLKLGGGA